MWGLPRLKRAASVLSPVARHAGVERGFKPACSTPVEPGLIGLVTLLPPSLLGQALTHSSWVSQRTVSYERLEFLGDSVLGLAIASALYERYPDKEEGELARIKAFVVSRTSCVQVAGRLDVTTLILEKSPASPQKRKEAAASSSVLGNVVEALIGACFIAHGFDRTAAAVGMAFDEQIRYAVTGHVDHKTTLQELLALRGLHPSYQLVAEDGPPHARHFTSEVWIDGAFRGRGAGTTIKMSEQHAAREALAFLKPREKE
jgi:ribonuclease-3